MLTLCTANCWNHRFGGGYMPSNWSARRTCSPTRDMRRSPGTPYGSENSCFGALTSIDAHGLRMACACPLFLLPMARQSLGGHGLFGQLLSPIDPELCQQQRCRFVGFHRGRVSATIVVSFCTLSLLSVAVGASASVKPVGEWPT